MTTEDTAHLTARILVDVNTDTHWIEFSFTSLLGETKTLIQPRSMIIDERGLVKALLDAGAKIHTSGKLPTAIRSQLDTSNPADMGRVTNRTGWLDDCFVMPSRTYGNPSTQLTYSSNEVLPAYLHGEIKGELQGWRQGLREPCKASTYLIAAISAAFAAPLLPFIKEREGVVFGLFAETSTGKTLALLAAASVIGKPERRTLQTFDVTKRAVQELAGGANHLALIIDEIARADRSETSMRVVLRDFAYVIASGSGRRVSNTVRNDLPQEMWETIGLISGELEIGDLADRAGGEEARLIAVMVPPSSEHGIFDQLERLGDVATSPHQLASGVEKAIRDHHGVAFDRYVSELATNRAKYEKRTRELTADFVERYGGTSAFERRIAGKFGLLAAAAVIAAELKVAPWGPQRGFNAVLRLYNTYAATHRSPEAAAADLCRHLTEERKNPALYPQRDKISNSVRNTDWKGVKFKDRNSQERILAVKREVIEQMVGTRLTSAVIQWLVEAGVVKRDPEGKSTHQTTINQERIRLVWFRVDKLVK